MENMNIIVNHTAQTGKGKQSWAMAKAILDESHVPYCTYETKYPGHAKALAREISAREGMQNLIVVGGDGTINEVLCGIEDFSNVRFGVIAAGSGNDFAKGTECYDTPECCMKRILNELKCIEETGIEPDKIDLGRVSWNKGKEYRIFGISSGIGMDAIVSKKALDSKLKTFLNRFGMGQLTYLLITIVTLLTMRTYTCMISYDGGRWKLYRKLIFAAAMNLKSEGGGVPMAPKATAYNGALTLCLAHEIGRIPVFGVLALLMMEKHERVKGVELTKFSECVIKAKTPMVVHADGEYCGDLSEVKYQCLKQCLILL